MVKVKTSIYVDREVWKTFRKYAMRRGVEVSSLLEENMGDKVVDMFLVKALKAYSGEATISFNIWNIGEVLGILGKAKTDGRLGNKEYTLARKRFPLETRRLIKLGQLIVVPLKQK